jgi:tetratricopeptide (TPR) repeat protein
MRVRVLIATTDGPVAVERIIPSPLRRSIVCEWNGKEPLRPLSTGYDQFVRRRQITQPQVVDSFRLDLSKRIDSGDSWQLGTFIAHALRAADRLAGREQAENAGTVLLATGKIEYGLSVGAVGYVEEKLRTSFDQLKAALASGQRVIVALPHGNASDGKTEQAQMRRIGIELVSVGEVRDIFKRLALAAPIWTPDADETWEGSPFRGLAVFEKRHRKIFFGRGKAREEALRQLRQQAAQGCAFLLIHGSSGAGKSSLARAGLLGDIESMSTVTEPWRTGILVPSRGGVPAVSALAEALVVAVPELPFDQNGLEGAIHANPHEAASLVAAALASRPDGGHTRLCLLIDQLEELLLWPRAHQARGSPAHLELFAEMLAQLARTEAAWIIATLRSDLLPLLDDSPTLSELAISSRMYRLERPSRAALYEIVRRPVEAAGLKLAGNDSEGLSFADVLVEAGANSPDSLPLLQFVLERLYEKEGRTGTIHYETYKAIGELTKAIGEWAESTVMSLNDDHDGARAVDDVILELGRPDSETGSIVGRSAVLEGDFLNPARARAIEALANARLLALDTVNGRRIARVAHEALLTHWPRAQSLFASRALALELRERLAREAKEWQAEQEHPTYLIPPGPRLTNAEQLLADSPIHLPEDVREFVLASVEKHARDQRTERERKEQQLAERRRRSERERLRLATDRQKLNGHLKAREYALAASLLDEMTNYLGEPETELAAERPHYEAVRDRVRRLSGFFADMKDTFAFAGEEDFAAAHSACERALTAFGVFDYPRWWEHLPTADLDADQATHATHEVYRMLLLFSGLQLVPGIVSLFPRSPGATPRRSAVFDPAKLVRLLPGFVLSALVRRNGLGPLKLPRRQDRPDALAHFDRSVRVLERVRAFEEVASPSGTNGRQSRTSHMVGQLVQMLRELASGPKDAPIDYRGWLVHRRTGLPPEPVNAADHFFVGLFNYFIAKRSDALFTKVVRLLEGRFPELDGRTPLATAERLLRAGIALEHDNFWPHWVLGRTLLTGGDYRGAELAFNAAISLQPRYARGYEQRALALAHQWRATRDASLYARAKADSELALATADGDPSVHWPRGELLEVFGETREALDAYSRWLEEEENVVAKISRGTGIIRLHALATAVLEHATSEGLAADAHALLALVYLTWARNDDAIRHAEQALRVDPHHEHALTAEGAALLHGGEPRRALDTIERPGTSGPPNPMAALVRARACEALAPDAAALAAWRVLKPGTTSSTRSPGWMQREAAAAEKRLLRIAHDDDRAIDAQVG